MMASSDLLHVQLSLCVYCANYQDIVFSAKTVAKLVSSDFPVLNSNLNFGGFAKTL